MIKKVFTSWKCEADKQSGLTVYLVNYEWFPGIGLEKWSFRVTLRTTERKHNCWGLLKASLSATPPNQSLSIVSIKDQSASSEL